MAMRSRMSRRKDKRIYSKTASTPKSINLGYVTYRGGRRL